MKNLFHLRMIIVLMINNIMCKDYKEYDIDLDDNKCLKIDCPYLYRDWFDYEYELQDGTSEWDYHEACNCVIKESNDNPICPLFGFTKDDNVKINYSY